MTGVISYKQVSKHLSVLKSYWQLRFLSQGDSVGVNYAERKQLQVDQITLFNYNHVTQ